jgi:hypothetical protein
MTGPFLHNIKMKKITQLSSIPHVWSFDPNLDKGLKIGDWVVTSIKLFMRS